MNFKEKINMSDDEIVEALTEYFGVKPVLKGEWKATVLDYVRHDYPVSVDDEGQVTVAGDEHYNWFGEWLTFYYINKGE
jgi:hypothetical protein